MIYMLRCKKTGIYYSSNQVFTMPNAEVEETDKLIFDAERDDGAFLMAVDGKPFFPVRVWLDTIHNMEYEQNCPGTLSLIYFETEFDVKPGSKFQFFIDYEEEL